jgi:hypothetical protein
MEKLMTACMGERERGEGKRKKRKPISMSSGSAFLKI